MVKITFVNNRGDRGETKWSTRAVEIVVLITTVLSFIAGFLWGAYLW